MNQLLVCNNSYTDTAITELICYFTKEFKEHFDYRKIDYLVNNAIELRSDIVCFHIAMRNQIDTINTFDFLTSLRKGYKYNFYEEVNEYLNNNDILLKMLKSDEVYSYIKEVSAGHRFTLENKAPNVISILINIY